MVGYWRWVAALLLMVAGWQAHASVAVLVGEPFGRFGTMMPSGHTAVYLDRVCADGPLHVRMCTADDETPGVVLARYHAIGQYDWMATPVMEFLYATERREDVPAYATAELVWEMRQGYRRRFLRGIVPDGMEGKPTNEGGAAHAGGVEEWWESAGMAYNRRLWAYQVETTPEDDQRLVEMLNASENRHVYRLRGRNCADFAAMAVNLYMPGAVHAGGLADLGLLTPKQVARSLSEYGAKHPDVGLKVWEIPQVPGSLRRSRPVRGGAEALLKTKRYVFTLAVLQPEVPASLAVLYLWHGRWKIGEGAGMMPLGAGLMPYVAKRGVPGVETAFYSGLKTPSPAASGGVPVISMSFSGLMPFVAEQDSTGLKRASTPGSE